jgi:hypothetical protein
LAQVLSSAWLRNFDVPPGRTLRRSARPNRERSMSWRLSDRCPGNVRVAP